MMVERFRQYISVLANQVIVGELLTITKKQNDDGPLSKEDLDFLMWFGTHSNLTREEFGRGKGLGFHDLEYDPEVELQRLRRSLNSIAD